MATMTPATLIFNSKSLRELILDHYPDLENFEMTVTSDGRFFRITEHEKSINNEDLYAIVYTLYLENGQFYFVPTYKPGGYPPKFTELWLEKVGSSDNCSFSKEYCLGRIHGTDFMKAVCSLGEETIFLRFSENILTIGDNSRIIVFTRTAGVYKKCV